MSRCSNCMLSYTWSWYVHIAQIVDHTNCYCTWGIFFISLLSVVIDIVVLPGLKRHWSSCSEFPFLVRNMSAKLRQTIPSFSCVVYFCSLWNMSWFHILKIYILYLPIWLWHVSVSSPMVLVTSSVIVITISLSSGLIFRFLSSIVSIIVFHLNQQLLLYGHKRKI